MSAGLGEASTYICCSRVFLVLFPPCCNSSEQQAGEEPSSALGTVFARDDPTAADGEYLGEENLGLNRVYSNLTMKHPEGSCPETPDTLVSLKQWYKVSTYF